MFKVKRIDNKKIYTILDTYVEPTFLKTYFFLFENGKWRWRPADSFEPFEYQEAYDDVPEFNFI